jgi:hypothetical protein
MSKYSAISWREQDTFIEIWDAGDVRIVPDPRDSDFYSASSLFQQFAGRRVDPLGDIILIPSQPVFVLSP